MIPLLNQGANGIARLTKEAKDLGAIYSGSIAKDAAEFGDNMKKIGLAAEAAGVSIAGPLISGLAKLSGYYLEAKKSGESFLPVLTAIASYATIPGQISLAGNIAAGNLFDKKTVARANVLASIKPEDSMDAVYRKFLRPPTKTAAPVVEEEPKKTRTGGGGGKDNSAEQEAKKRLAFDLDQIKNASAVIIDTIANSEKILEAERAAALTSEADYYAQKRKFLLDNNAEQVRAAQAEIDRLKQEVLLGADKIDNDRKIADAQAKLNKLREAGATNVKVLGIQEKNSLDNIARAYEDAEAAAQSYLDVITRAARAEIAGVGKGNKAREFAGGISGIEEKFEAQREELQRDNRNGKFIGRQDDYDRNLARLNSSQAAEIALYRAKYATLDEMQKDWKNGATEALKNYYDETQNTAKLTEQAFTNAFSSIEDAIAEFVKTGKLDFKGLINSILADITRLAIKQSITGPLANLLSGLIGGSTGGSSTSGGGTDIIGSLISGLSGRAIGGPVSAGGMYRVNERGPELLNVAGSQYLMMGNQGGTVSPNVTKPGASMEVTNNFSLSAPVDRRTQQQIGHEVYVSSRRAARRLG
ncbi:MAG: phage tail tape measure protein [Comamonadaceae bacterium]|nr:MAG: phage tail tape measure protein [Comamonadaceae bacterium]